MERVQNCFYRDSENNIKIYSYGVYKKGLTRDEIKNYLRARSGKYAVANLYKKFVKIAGVNTMSMYSCSCCDFNTSLMYHHDVERFANVLFGVTTSTYFD